MLPSAQAVAPSQDTSQPSGAVHCTRQPPQATAQSPSQVRSQVPLPWHVSVLPAPADSRQLPTEAQPRSLEAPAIATQEPVLSQR